MLLFPNVFGNSVAMPKGEKQLQNVLTDTAAADGVFARVISVLWIASWYEVRHGGFAVAECGA